MKTKEFIKRVEAMGYKVDRTLEILNVRASDGAALLKVKTDCDYKLDTMFNVNIPFGLFDLAVSYAATPLEERKEDKLYYVINHENETMLYKTKLGYIKGSVGVNVHELKTDFFVHEKPNYQFTEQEIKSAHEGYWTFAKPVDDYERGDNNEN